MNKKNVLILVGVVILGAIAYKVHKNRQAETGKDASTPNTSTSEAKAAACGCGN